MNWWDDFDDTKKYARADKAKALRAAHKKEKSDPPPWSAPIWIDPQRYPNVILYIEARRRWEAKRPRRIR